jgi:hypothetical protein
MARRVGPADGCFHPASKAYRLSVQDDPESRAQLRENRAILFRESELMCRQEEIRAAKQAALLSARSRNSA